MKIGVIGAGNIGATLARKLAASGHEVKIANSKGPESLRALAHDIGATTVTKEGALEDVDVVILSIPFSSYRELTCHFLKVPRNTIVVDTSNYYPFRDGVISGIDGGIPESVWVELQLGLPVIKAWNAALATTLAERGSPKGTAGRIAIPVSGDEPASKSIIMGLVEETGFDAVDAGVLSESWRQQPGTPAYCTELTKDELVLALESADRLKAPVNRDRLIEKFMQSQGGVTHDEIVELNRIETK
ncbi:3-hydroxyisobutyrate dehydrogenase [Ochrobactrum soli]|jgi:predicted dinucleotide-binding enzyme|uniref:NADPH-dependent F420 reductase n=1 Tax=Brucella/Ochrobactrum group TaxID=2826938 RepID=UPI000EF22691|nr:MULTISPECIES: NAD(P)-binding domain-containing protein [Brucella]RLL64624.1 3-hydroxyisobutyrate dehydrogenase [[Ochrobactrum] soli]WHS30045.1 NAD(P)-binding domain-containing protein [Brucella sp. NM4]WHT44472.1 NAD(P)-binding domain-containing protein [Ochrobactrum sp. SSR]